MHIVFSNHSMCPKLNITHHCKLLRHPLWINHSRGETGVFRDNLVITVTSRMFIKHIAVIRFAANNEYLGKANKFMKEDCS